MSVFLLVLMLSDREVFRPVSTAEEKWTASSAWDQKVKLPEKEDRVLIPGRSRQSRSIVISAGEAANAASLMVGTTAFGEGNLTIYGSLTGHGTAQDRQAGRMYVGHQFGTGVVMQEPGSIVDLGKSLRVGYRSAGKGSYFVRSATLRVAKDIQIATHEEAEALLDLTGPTAVHSNTFRSGGGKARLEFTSVGADVPSLSVNQSCDFGGSLRVDLRSLSNAPETIPLVLAGTSSGGFRQVRVLTQPDVHYELSYAGGAGSDLVLNQLARPWSSFEEWQAHRFGKDSLPTTSGPFADPDGDQVPNIGEYKLGCCPHTNEGDPLRIQVNSRGDVSFRYVERTDRDDVRVVPQASRDGRIWSSEYLTTRVIRTSGNTRVIRATAVAPDLSFRLAFEMLPEAGTQPNVLFVVIDDLNDWTEGLGGHPQALTPNLNRIAARGVRFTQAYTAAALCNPARVSFLTGRRPSSTGIYDNDGSMRNSPVLKDAVTIPENFKASNYYISGGGKLFHGSPEVSWDDYFPSLTKNRNRDPVPPDRPLNGITEASTRWFDWGPVDVEDSRMGDAQVATWIEGQLASPQEQPFLLTCGFFRPHLPLYVPPEYFEPFKEVSQPPGIFLDDRDDLPQAALDWVEEESGSDHRAVLANGEWNKAVRGYLASVYFADRQLGRVLDALDTSPSLRNTIVVVTSDHGWHVGEKDHWRKSSMWEAACRVPLIISVPGLTTPGTECHESVSLIDLYPTFNELCGLDEIPSLEGESLVPQLRDPAAVRTVPAITTRFYNHTVRDQRWRYTRYETGEEELYDHASDRYERHNLAADEQYRGVMIQLGQWIPKSQHDPVIDED